MSETFKMRSLDYVELLNGLDGEVSLLGNCRYLVHLLVAELHQTPHGAT